jgi:acetyl esterase/lipase
MVSIPIILRCRIWAAILVAICALAAAPTPPGQPKTGPGGSGYPFAAVTVHRYGQGVESYWIFEPASPTPKSAPVIVFCHGWGVMSPNSYGAWIKHLVRRGNIVIYPQYQVVLLASMKDFTPYCLAAEKAAFVELKSSGHVTPELDHVAIVGHSMGGAIVPNLAADAARENLPVPKAICCVEPDNHAGFAPAIQMPMDDFTKIPATTLTLFIVGDRDRVAREDTAREIYPMLSQIPPQKKNYIKLISDDHGFPPLIASHAVPIANAELDPAAEDFETRGRNRQPDAISYYGLWKLFDGLTDSAFYNKNQRYALGNTPEQRYMGQWSDGTPVKPLLATTQP